MNWDQSMWHYLQQLHHFHLQQVKKNEELLAMILGLQKEIKELKERPATRIDKIEYKFDQLKVETLEGTLNIGLNPTGQDGIEDFSVTQGMKVPPVPYSGNFGDLRNSIQLEIDQFLDHEAKVVTEELELQFHKPLNDSYRKWIIEDIRRQLPARIEYYLNKTPAQGEQGEMRDASSIKLSIIDRVKQDVQSSIEAFIRHLPNEQNGGS